MIDGPIGKIVVQIGHPEDDCTGQGRPGFRSQSGLGDSFAEAGPPRRQSSVLTPEVPGGLGRASANEDGQEGENE